MKKSQPQSIFLYEQFFVSRRKTKPGQQITPPDPAPTKLGSFLFTLQELVQKGVIVLPISEMSEPLIKLFAKNTKYEIVRKIWDEAINELLSEEDPYDTTTLDT